MTGIEEALGYVAPRVAEGPGDGMDLPQGSGSPARSCCIRPHKSISCHISTTFPRGRTFSRARRNIANGSLRVFDSITSNFRQAGWAFSLDKGQSWTFPGVLTPGLFRSDPVLDSDSSGAIYYQSLQEDFDVDVFKSLNGGMTWEDPIPAFGGDKNWMAVDKSGGLGDGHVYGI